MSELFLGIRGKPYRNQMVHSELRLKIMCSKAVSHFSLTHLEKKMPKIKPSSIRYHVFTSMTRILNSMPKISQSSNFSPQFSMYPECDYQTRTLKLHSSSILCTKKMDRAPCRFNPLIVLKNSKPPSLTIANPN